MGNDSDDERNNIPEPYDRRQELRNRITDLEHKIEETTLEIRESEKKLKAIKRKEGISEEYKIEMDKMTNSLTYRNTLAMELAYARQELTSTNCQIWSALFKLTNMIEQLHESRQSIFN